MKKFSIFAVAAFIAAVMAFPVTASAGTGSYIKGDSNGDGVVDIMDVTVIQRVLAELNTDDDGLITKRADIDGDGLSITDATGIQLYIAGYVNNNHVGETVSETPQTTRDKYELPFIPAR